MKKLALLIIIAVYGYGCTYEKAAITALQKAGYTNVQTYGYAILGCSADDEAFNTKFTATNPLGQRVSGVVCCGILKSCTIRF